MKLFHIAMSGRRGRPISFKGRRRRGFLLSPPKYQIYKKKKKEEHLGVLVCNVALLSLQLAPPTCSCG